MDFPRVKKATQTTASLPAALVGLWKIGAAARRFEFRADSRYYVHQPDVPYQLMDSGATLDFGGTRFTRVFGDPASLPGVWALEGDPAEEWNLRADGSYTYHWPGFEYFGDYSYDATKVSTIEMRAVLTESNGTIIFDPPYQLSVAGSWSITEPELTIDFPSGPVVYTRAAKRGG